MSEEEHTNNDQESEFDTNRIIEDCYDLMKGRLIPIANHSEETFSVPEQLFVSELMFKMERYLGVENDE